MGNRKIVYMARHGQTDWNREKRFQGKYDIPLNDTGIKQAGALALLLEDVKIEYIFSSPKTRALETARIVARGKNLEVEQVEELREISHGIFDGLTLDEVNTSHEEEIRKWREDRINIAPPEGESIRECYNRIAPVFDSIVSRTGNSPILLVSHMVVTKVILIHCLGVPLETFWRFDQGSTCLNKIRYNEKGPIIELLNYTGHIEGLE